jgi:DNA-binding response OmpR family regulator
MANSPQRRVLVVDDDPDLLDLLSDRLRLMQFAVERADDGEEALRRLRYDPAPITLLDL